MRYGLYTKHRGIRKRKHTLFKKGHASNPASHESCPPVADDNPPTSQSIEQEPQICPNVVVTRSRASKNETNPVESEEYGIVKLSNFETLMNMFIAKHQQNSPGCNGKAHLNKVEQRLISLSFRMTCDKCKFSTESVKMYGTVSQPGKRGPKDSTLNRSLASALLNSSIGPGQFIEICLCLGINPGSESGLNNQINETGRLTQKLAVVNMETERRSLADLSGETDLGISVDAIYNNRINNKTPFQAGTQAVFTAVSTKNKKILHIGQYNKLCKVGTDQRSKGLPVSCPNHSNCTANVNISDPIGDEGKYAVEALKLMQRENVKLQYVVSDGDSKISKAVRECHGSCVETQMDPRHFSNGIYKKIVSVDFRPGTFKGSNKQTRDKHKRWFANDLVHRCNAEFSAAANKCKTITDNVDKKQAMNNLLNKIPECIISCASNDCKSCKLFSLVCDGKSPWSEKEVTYKESVELCGKDKETLVNILAKRLGPEGISLTYRNKNTQLNEAINRGYCKVNPKNVTCSRNFFARTAREVLTINKGFEASLGIIHKAIGHKVCATIQKKITRRELIRQKDKKRQKSLQFKRKRRLCIIKKYHLYQNKVKKLNKHEVDLNEHHEPYQKHVDLNLTIDLGQNGGGECSYSSS